MGRVKLVLLWLTVVVVLIYFIQSNRLWNNNDISPTSQSVVSERISGHRATSHSSHIKPSLPNIHTTKLMDPEAQEEHDLQVILETAKKISEKPVLVTLINDGYLSLAQNWLCNTKHMGIHKQVLIITMNAAAKETLQLISPEVNVVVMTVESYLQKDQDYSHVGYLRLILRRTRILHTLLQNDIETFLFECDFLWIRNPIPVFRSHEGKYDIVFIHNSVNANSINGGFFYMFPTSITKQVFQELYNMMLKLATKIKNMPPNKAVSEGENDQIYLSALVNKRYAGLKSTMLPLSDFPDGKWYSWTESKRKQLNPYIIHNNWVIGNKKKVSRVKEWGHWFLKDDNTCDFNRVDNVTRT